MLRSKTRASSCLTTVTFTMAALMVGTALYVLLSTLSLKTPGSPERWATKVELRSLEPGEPHTVVFNNRAVFALRLTEQQLQDVSSIEVADLVDPNARNANLSPTDKANLANRTFEADGTFLVVEGMCGPSGHIPMYGQGDFDAWFCPGRGAHFDILGRVHRGAVRENLQIPRYRLSEQGELILVDWIERKDEDELDRLLYGTDQQD